MNKYILLIPSFLFLFNISSWSQCAPSTAMTALDANNVSTIMLAGGDMWWDFNNARYEVPAGGGASALFSGAIWLGGVDDSGSLHLASQRYRQSGNDYWNGPLDTSGFAYAAVCTDYDRHWKVTQTMITDFLNGGTNPIPEPILTWPGKGNPNGFNSFSNLAPFVDVNNDGIYDAEDGDYPQILGDQAIWWVLNDVGNFHSNSLALPLGVEIHVMAYAYATQNDLNNTTFYNYTVINKSENDYHDFYVGMFTDVDLGNSLDDRIGCDTSLNLGYAYNGNSFDADGPFNLGYGLDLPIIGIKMLQLPKDENGNEISMSSFGYMNNGAGSNSDPEIGSDYYNRLKGLRNDGTSYTNAGDGITSAGLPTKFVFPGNPSDSTQWSECSAGIPSGDRRFAQSFGPMELNSNAPITFTYAAIWAQDSAFQGICKDLTAYFDITQDVQDFHDSTHCKDFAVAITGVVSLVDTINSTSGDIDISVSGSSSSLYYSWSDGSTNEDLQFSDTGSYTVTVSDDFGCSDTASFSVSAPDDIIDGTLELASKLEISIFPNPSSNGLFNVSGANKALNASVFDVLGNHVVQTSITNRLDLSQHSSGIYFVKLSDGASEQVIRVLITD